VVKGGGPTWQLVGPYPQWYNGIDDGAWEQMTKPGAAGYGLLVWQSSMMGCSHEDPVNQIFSRTHWLTPAFCYWQSLTTEDYTYVDYDLLRGTQTKGGDDTDPSLAAEIDHDTFAEVPLLKVTNVMFLDHMSQTPETLDTNLWAADRQFMFDTNPYQRENNVASTMGLMPVWTVTNISREYFRPWLAQSINDWASWPGLNYTDLNCLHQRDQMHVTAYDPVTKLWRYLCTDDECVCEVNGWIDELETVQQAMPNFADMIEYHYEDVWTPTWTYAKNRFRQGWEQAEHLSHQGEAPCSSSLLQQFSPYWGSSSSRTSIPASATAS